MLANGRSGWAHVKLLFAQFQRNLHDMHKRSVHTLLSALTIGVCIGVSYLYIYMLHLRVPVAKLLLRSYDKDDRVLNSGVVFQVRDTIHAAGYHCEADTSDRKLQKKVRFNFPILSSLLWLDGLHHSIILSKYSQSSLLAIALVCVGSWGTVGTI